MTPDQLDGAALKRASQALPPLPELIVACSRLQSQPTQAGISALKAEVAHFAKAALLLFQVADPGDPSHRLYGGYSTSRTATPKSPGISQGVSPLLLP